MLLGIYRRGDFEFIRGELVEYQVRDGGPDDAASEVLYLYFTTEEYRSSFWDDFRRLRDQGIEEFELISDYPSLHKAFHIDDMDVRALIYRD